MSSGTSPARFQGDPPRTSPCIAAVTNDRFEWEESTEEGNRAPPSPLPSPSSPSGAAEEVTEVTEKKPHVKCAEKPHDTKNEQSGGRAEARERFAASAMQGFIAGQTARGAVVDKFYLRLFAFKAFEAADAMLAAMDELAAYPNEAPAEIVTAIREHVAMEWLMWKTRHEAKNKNPGGK